MVERFWIADHIEFRRQMRNSLPVVASSRHLGSNFSPPERENDYRYTAISVQIHSAFQGEQASERNGPQHKPQALLAHHCKFTPRIIALSGAPLAADPEPRASVAAAAGAAAAVACPP